MLAHAVETSIHLFRPIFQPLLSIDWHENSKKKKPYLIPRRNPPNLPPRIRIPYARQVALLEAQVGHGRELVSAARARGDARVVEFFVFLVRLLLVLVLVLIFVLFVDAAVVESNLLQADGFLLGGGRRGV